MRIWDAVERLNERKAIANNDPEREREGEIDPTGDTFRRVLVGLDLDVIEVDKVAGGCARHALKAAMEGRIPLELAMKMVGFDLFAAGVYYERERSSAAASGDSA